ncbi:MAG: DUF305 domain-containing protein [Pyrinomonadaceae bacterium]
MKKLSLIALIAILTACAGPPKGTEVDRSKVDHSTMDHSKTDHSKMESSPGAAEQPYDLQFIDTMIVHHQGAVDMALLVKTRSRQAELIALAASIINDQAKEIAQMKKWREDRFAGKPAAVNMNLAGMQDGMKGMDMPKLDSLKDREFDLEFIKQMVPHHEGAVVMAKEALQKSENAEIKNLAKSIINSQDVEIKKMRDWRSSWDK